MIRNRALAQSYSITSVEAPVLVKEDHFLVCHELVRTTIEVYGHFLVGRHTLSQAELKADGLHTARYLGSLLGSSQQKYPTDRFDFERHITACSKC